VAFAPSAGGVTATVTGSSLRTDEHSLGLLLFDVATGKPLPLDYGFATTRTTQAGVVATVSVAFGGVTPPPSVLAYLMVDAYPAGSAVVPIP
ncbi:MAG TPA: hypothetical protein VE911_01000, partial [Candidatus Nitrosopolaris sp.]|nr:hypothetical protein [Candidatus Nitrosopolaris sp.]